MQFNAREAKARDHHKKELEVDEETEEEFWKGSAKSELSTLFTGSPGPFLDMYAFKAPAVMAAHMQWEDAAKHKSAFKQHLGRPEVQVERNEDLKRSCKFMGRLHPGISDNSEIRDISQDF